MQQDILKRILINKHKPEAAKDLTPAELIDLVLVVLGKIKHIEGVVQSGILKGDAGKTPVPNVDFLSKVSSENILAQAIGEVKKDVAQTLKGIKNPKNGKDGKNGSNYQITSQDYETIAQIASDAIDLPDFTKLITQEPESIRDSLELLQGKERLSINSIDGVDEVLNDIYKRIATRPLTEHAGGGGKSWLFALGDVKADGITDGQVLAYNATTGHYEPADPGSAITGTDTQVLYFDGDDNPTGDADFTWDKTNNQLKVDNTYISNPQTSSISLKTTANNNMGTNSVVISDSNNMDESSSENVIIGMNIADNQASTPYERRVLIGYNIATGSSNFAQDNNVVIGLNWNTSIRAENIIMGAGNSLAGDISIGNVLLSTFSSIPNEIVHSVMIGKQQNVTGTNGVIALGAYAVADSDNQMVAGSTTVPINDVKLGVNATSTNGMLRLQQGTGATLTEELTAPGYNVEALNSAPASASATGTLGEIRYTADYIYVCTATDTWKRSSLSTW